MRRRDWLLGLAGLALWPATAIATATTAAARLDAPGGGLKRWGSGEFRRFGFLIYEATLWASGRDPLQPPLALALTYKRNLSGKRIAEASVNEMRNLDSADETRLQNWGLRMAQIFPDVQPEERIVGLYLAEGARFFHNDRPLGHIDDPAFARAFFGIWLDARTSAPELRAALLKPVAD